MPYGQVQWKQGDKLEELGFDFGCTSPQARQLLSQIDQADSVIGAAWNEAKPQPEDVKP
jgi:hypothetical protein